jgi:hypothetical protein
MTSTQGMRKNDINEQMRVIAQELTPDEMHAVAAPITAAQARIDRLAVSCRLSASVRCYVDKAWSTEALKGWQGRSPWRMAE